MNANFTIKKLSFVILILNLSVEESTHLQKLIPFTPKSTHLSLSITRIDARSLARWATLASADLKFQCPWACWLHSRFDNNGRDGWQMIRLTDWPKDKLWRISRAAASNTAPRSLSLTQQQLLLLRVENKTSGRPAHTAPMRVMWIAVWRRKRLSWYWI